MALLSACAPSISDLKPSTGVAGDTILITGGKLTVGGSNPSSVDFNGTTATFKAAGNDVQADVPIGATSGPVHVTTSYVDSYSPGGTATSPYDFTVATNSFNEQEKNDTQKTANNAALAEIIKGSITDTDPADWFKIKSGPSGPWGYGVEITAEPKALPQGVSLRVDMEGYLAASNAVGSLTTYHDSKPFTLWTTQAPNTDIFLTVYWNGSTSEAFGTDYTLKIARIKIDDSNEADDALQSAKQITMANGQGVHKASFLCNILKNGADVGMKDFYSFDAGGATQIGVVVVTPPLDQSDGVKLGLYDNAQGYVDNDAGNNVAANVNHKVPGGKQATGQWYAEVTNAWDHYATAGAGPTDQMPLSCKAPYTILVLTK